MKSLLKIGDCIIFCNDYGVTAGPKVITGIETIDGAPRYHVEPTDTPWYPYHERNLVPEKIVAAAKDLLAALELVTMELKQMHAHYQPKCEGGCPSTEYIAQAEAAILKAGGEIL